MIMIKGLLFATLTISSLLTAHYVGENLSAQGLPWENRAALKALPNLKPFALPIQWEAYAVRNEKFGNVDNPLKLDFYRLTPTGIWQRQGEEFELVDINGVDLDKKGFAKDDQLVPAKLETDYGYISMLSSSADQNGIHIQVEGFGVFYSQYALDRAKNYISYLNDRKDTDFDQSELKIENRGRFVAFVQYGDKIFQVNGLQNDNLLELKSQSPSAEYFSAIKELQTWDEQKLGTLLAADKVLKAKLASAADTEKDAIKAERASISEQIKTLKASGGREKIAQSAVTALESEIQNKKFNINLSIQDQQRVVRIELDEKDALKTPAPGHPMRVRFSSFNDGQDIAQERLNYIHQLTLDMGAAKNPVVGIFSEYFRVRDYRTMPCESMLELHQPMVGFITDTSSETFSYTVADKKPDLVFGFDLKQVAEKPGYQFNLLYWIASQDQAGGKSIRTFKRDLSSPTVFVDVKK